MESSITNQIKILQEFENKNWVTKDGKKIKIKDLSLAHLRNIRRYLKRYLKATSNPIHDYPSFDGEMAEMAAEREWRYAMDRYEFHKRNYQLFKTYYNIKTL